jgi:hypothetical protein
LATFVCPYGNSSPFHARHYVIAEALFPEFLDGWENFVSFRGQFMGMGTHAHPQVPVADQIFQVAAELFSIFPLLGSRS